MRRVIRKSLLIALGSVVLLLVAAVLYLCTNPYIKLGGTLSNPAVEIKPLEAVTSTGVAVATLGISILARGSNDCVSAERKVCARALKRIEKKAAERDSRP
jgi:hypothetical protein